MDALSEAETQLLIAADCLCKKADLIMEQQEDPELNGENEAQRTELLERLLKELYGE